MIHDERIRRLNRLPERRGRYVLYWMQASQRVEWNHALEFAIDRANELGLPVVAGFGLMDDYPEANARHTAFMLEGLSEVQHALAKRGVLFVARRGSPDAVAVALAKDAAMAVCDKGYLRHQKRWRRNVVRAAECPVVEVESDAVVPVETASIKEEYAAATLRPKLHRLLSRFMAPLRPRRVKQSSLQMDLPGLDLSVPARVLATLSFKSPVAPVTPFYRGGARAANELLDEFIARKLDRYDMRRNDPSQDVVSHMSPYLHFGQISPLEIALRVRNGDDKRPEAVEAYLEELIVRRELSLNFVYFNKDYDAFRCLPNWATQSLRLHEKDDRPTRYTAGELESARTHDPYWNAAQRELTLTGKMHNYMRMYWGKKILEWRAKPADAFRIALRLNNRYELDGRDPNSFAGVAWCFGKHDRPWTERSIFGTVRYMNAKGLERKFDMAAYVEQVNAIAAACPT